MVLSFFLLIAAVFLISFAFFSFFLSLLRCHQEHPPPPRHPSPISLQVPPPPPPLPLLRLFLPSSGQLLQLQHFCNPSFPHNSRETHTHTHTNAITGSSGKKIRSSCFCGGREKKKHPLCFLWKQTPPSPPGEQKTASSSSLWKQSGSCHCCCCNLSLSLSASFT